MQSSEHPRRQRRWQAFRYVGPWLAWTTTLGGLSLALVWCYGERQLLPGLATDLARRVAGYGAVVRLGGVDALRRLDTALPVVVGEAPPPPPDTPRRIGPWPVPSAGQATLRRLLLRSGAVAAISQAPAAVEPSADGIWIQLHQRDAGGRPVWVYATDLVSSLAIWRLWMVWSVAGGVMAGSLMVLGQARLQPPRQAPDARLRRNAAHAQQRLYRQGLLHDIRSPLGRIRLRSEQLALGLVPPDALAEAFRAMEADVDQLCELTGLLAGEAEGLADGGAACWADGGGADGPERLELQIADLLEQVVGRYGSGAVQLESERRVLRLDAVALRRSLANLIENALEHGRPPVLVRAGCSNGVLLISVEDHGPGLRAPGLRSGARSPHRGLGLGIVERFCRSHAGSLVLFPSSHGGLRAEMRLPLDPLA